MTTPTAARCTHPSRKYDDERGTWFCAGCHAEPDLAGPFRYLAAWSRARSSAAWRPVLEQFAAAAPTLGLPAIVSVPPRYATSMSAATRWADTASSPLADIAAEIRRIRTRRPA